MFDNVKLVNETFPDKKLIFTEGCVDASNLKSSTPGDWAKRTDVQ